MRSACIIAICLTVIALGGCASGLTGSPSATIDEKYATGCPVTVMNDTAVSSLAANRTTYDAATTEAQRRPLRDTFIARCVNAIDGSYRAFAVSLRTDEKSFAIGAETLGAGFTSAAALAKRAQTKTSLATYATFILGLRGTADKELFLDRALDGLRAQMEASRAKAYVPISKGMTLTDAEYPLDTAIANLQAYFYAGTLDGALNGVTNDAFEKQNKAAEEVVSVNTFKYANDALHKSLRKYLQPDGLTVDMDHQAKLVECTPVIPGTTATRRDMGRMLEAGPFDLREAMAKCVKGKDPSFNYPE